MAYKLRVRDTIDNLELFVDFIKFLEDEHYLVINSISSFYPDNNSLYARCYIELQHFKKGRFNYE